MVKKHRSRSLSFGSANSNLSDHKKANRSSSLSPVKGKKKKTREKESCHEEPNETAVLKGNSLRAGNRERKMETVDDKISDRALDQSSKAGNAQKVVVVDNGDHELETMDAPVKRSPALDLVVHRMRHLSYQPHSIVILRATPKHSKYSYLAVSRENGCVELRSVNQKIRTLCTIGGDANKVVNAMAWIMLERDGNSTTNGNSPTLIGASQDGSLFVLNFQSLRLESVTPSGGGGIFVLESLYENGDGAGSSLIAAGCEDGSVRVYQCSANLELTLFSTVPTTGAPVVSLAWRRMDSESSSNGEILFGTYMFAGVADGTIRMYSYQTGGSRTAASWKSGYRMTVESHGRCIPTRIWTLKVLQDWTVISSDSLGNVQFWDGQTGSLEKSFQQTDLRSDVLDIAVTSDECKVFASGIDSRVVCFERQSPQKYTRLGEENEGDDDIENEEHDFDNRQWIMTHAQRPHTHDVKSLAVCFQEKPENSGSVMELLCSGGVDMKLCTYLIRSFQTKRPRAIFPWPAESPIIVAQQARLLAIIRDACAEVHQIGKHNGEVMEPIPMPEDESLLSTIEIQTQSNLTCGAFSDNGHFMVLCDSFSVFVFELDHAKAGFAPKRIPYESQPASSVSKVVFVSNSTILLALSNHRIIILDIDLVDGGCHELKTRQTISFQSDGPQNLSDRLPPSMIVTTDSGKMFATLYSTHGRGAVEIFVRGDEGDDIYYHWWNLPNLSSSITTIGFIGTESESRLAVGCVNFELYLFDIGRRELDPWTTAALGGNSVVGPVPTELSNRTDYPGRICAHPSCPGKVHLVRSPCRSLMKWMRMQERHFRHKRSHLVGRFVIVARPPKLHFSPAYTCAL